MASFRRSMSSVNASMLAVFICCVTGASLYALLKHAHGVDIAVTAYNEPLEEKFEISDQFMGSPVETKADNVVKHSAPVWSYSGSTAPDRWGELGVDYALCSKGKQQSPIDIVRAQLSSKLLPVRFNYRDADVALKNTGNGLHLNYESGSYLEFDGLRYDLVRVDFHSPSEHLIDGIPYDMEIQLVHENSEGLPFVVAVLVEEGESHKALATLWNGMPERSGDTGNKVSLNATSFLPKIRSYFSYRGSLTTPPCREGVRWVVMTRPISFSEEQVDKFLGVVRYNARPPQALEGRSILRSRR